MAPKKNLLYDEIEVEEMEYDAQTGLLYYPCPCGDFFQISTV